eukprot:COSAG03_NODE_2754_length_2473_cov_1.385847_2_plen_275_part_00
MSKYGNLRKEDGTHSKFFLTRTLAEHDDTMDHPFMKAIYDQSVANDTFHRYLAGQYHLFRALEEHLAIAATTPPLDAVHDASLARTTALESDLRHHCGGRWAQAEGLTADASNALRNYIEQLSKDAASPHRLLCHHFLQYNAVLSGGSYLRRMLNKKFERPEGNQEGVAFFCFAHVPVSKQAAYVQSYCKKLDKLSLSGQQRNEMLACMKLVYKLTLAMLDELAPRDAKAVAAATVWNDQVVEDGIHSAQPMHYSCPIRVYVSFLGAILCCEQG